LTDCNDTHKAVVGYAILALLSPFGWRRGELKQTFLERTNIHLFEFPITRENYNPRKNMHYGKEATIFISFIRGYI
jgi:hypothetical protein